MFQESYSCTSAHWNVLLLFINHTPAPHLLTIDLVWTAGPHSTDIPLHKSNPIELPQSTCSLRQLPLTQSYHLLPSPTDNFDHIVPQYQLWRRLSYYCPTKFIQTRPSPNHRKMAEQTDRTFSHWSDWERETLLRKVFELEGEETLWLDVVELLPGRTVEACRTHYYRLTSAPVLDEKQVLAFTLEYMT